MSDNNDIQAGGPRLRLAPYWHTLPEYNNIDPGGEIVWAQNAAYTLAITGTPTGGTFAATVVVNGVSATTSALAYNANAAAIQTAIRALANVGSGNATVTGSGTFTVTFIGDLAETPVTLTGDGALLTGGTAPAATATSTQTGYGYSEPLVAVSDVETAFKESSDDFHPVYELWRTHDTITMQGIDGIKFEIAHRDVDAFKYALGAYSKASTAAGANQTGFDYLGPTENAAPTYYRLISELVAPGGGYYLLSYNKIRFAGDLSLKLGLKQTRIPINAKCFKPDDGNVFDIFEQTADAAS